MLLLMIKEKYRKLGVGQYMYTVCIAGKNNIAINVLKYIQKNIHDVILCFISNRTDNGIDLWQKSAKKYCKNHDIKEINLDEAYNIKNLLFLSLEYDRIVRPEKFISDKLYNVHFSLLPKYKGMYTSIWPILNNETESGVTLHRIRNGIDTGEIVDQVSFSIDYNMNSYQLYNKYIEAGTEIAIKNIENLIEGNVNMTPQEKKKSTYYSKDSIDFSSLYLNTKATANQIHNQIRAFAFKPYQLLTLNGRRLISSMITDRYSCAKPGTIIDSAKDRFIMATMDYDIIVTNEVD